MYNRLQYISQGKDVNEHISNITGALDGGCKWIQLRLKNIPLPMVPGAASRVKQLCDSYKAMFIVNDYIHAANQSRADGVHLGLKDTSIAKARIVLGPDKIIGGSANTYADCLQRVNEGCNYIGLGPFKYTTTKEKLSPILGVEGFRQIISQLRQDNIPIPVYAIGGIGPDDIEELMDTGIYGIAVSGVITNAADKKQIIQLLNSKLNKEYVNHS